jgi:DNA topoisomerase IB
MTAMEQKARAKIAHAKRSSRYIASVQQHQPKQQARPTSPDQSRLSPSTTKLLKRLGLKHITTAELTIRRRRHGRGFGYFQADGPAVRAAEKRRLAALAVPPAYEDVLYAADPNAHIQAVGRDAAGRLQYRIIRNGSACARCAKRAGSLGWRTHCHAISAASISI